MDVNDEAEILAKLGILASKEESPRKEVQLKVATGTAKFVDVNMNGDANSDMSDDDSIFDRDTLLASRNIRSGSRERMTMARRNPESPFCRFLLVAVSFFVGGIAVHSCPDVLRMSRREGAHGLSSVHALGLLIGALLSRLFVPRISSTWLLFLAVTALCIVSAILTAPQEVNTMYLIVMIQGITIASIKYAGISTWFMWWRSSKRKFLWLMFIFALGVLCPVLIRSDQNFVEENNTVTSSIHSIHKRALGDTMDTSRQDLLNKLERAMHPPVVESPDASQPPPIEGEKEEEGEGTTTFKPKKPEVAVGTEEIDTKTKQNEEKRQEAEVAEKNGGTVVNTTVGGSVNGNATTSTIPTTTVTTTTPATTTTPTTTSTSTTTTTTTSTTTTSTIAPIPLPTRVKESSEEKKEKSSIPGLDKLNPLISSTLPRLLSVVDPSTEMFVFVTLSLCTLLFVFSLCFCCLSSSFIPDSRVAKLVDHSCHGLSARVRIRLGVLYSLSALLSSTLMMAAGMLDMKGDGYTIACCGSVLVVAFVAFLGGHRSCTFQFGAYLYATLLLGTIWLAFDHTSLVAFVLCSGPAAMLNCIVFMQVESKVSPRPRLNIDIFLFCIFGARFGLAIVTLLAGPLSVSTLSKISLIASLLICVAYVQVYAQVYKAAQLKDIYDFATEGELGTRNETTFVGNNEYTTLVERTYSSDESDV